MAQQPATVSGFDELWIWSGIVLLVGFLAGAGAVLIWRAF